MEVRRGDMSRTPLPENNYSEAGRSRYGSSERGYSVCDWGIFEKIKLFAEDYLLEMLDEHTTEEAQKLSQFIGLFYDIGIAEIRFDAFLQSDKPDDKRGRAFVISLM